MPEEATRKLLKLFGIAVTDFEDQTKILRERLAALASPGQTTALILESAHQWLKAHEEVMARWQEVTQWLLETQAQVRAELIRAVEAARQVRGE